MPIRWPLIVSLAFGVALTNSSLAASVSDAGVPAEKVLRLRGVTGKPCLSFKTMVRPDVILKETYQHVISVENSCPKFVVVKLCYRNSTSGCQELHVRGYGTETTILGVMGNMPGFEFDYTERFLK